MSQEPGVWIPGPTDTDGSERGFFAEEKECEFSGGILPGTVGLCGTMAGSVWDTGRGAGEIFQYKDIGGRASGDRREFGVLGRPFCVIIGLRAGVVGVEHTIFALHDGFFGGAESVGYSTRGDDIWRVKSEWESARELCATGCWRDAGNKSDIGAHSGTGVYIAFGAPDADRDRCGFERTGEYIIREQRAEDSLQHWIVCVSDDCGARAGDGGGGEFGAEDKATTFDGKVCCEEEGDTDDGLVPIVSNGERTKYEITRVYSEAGV